MASPDSSAKPAPKSPAFQESPFTSYASSLSPLKLAETRPSTQPYAGTNFPAPEPVFTSPQFTRPRELSLLKRLTGEGGYPSQKDNAVTSTPENVVITTMQQMIHLVPCSRMKHRMGGPPIDQSCASPLTSVDTYLVDPSENYEDPSGEPEHCLDQAAVAAPDVQADFVNCDEDQLIRHQDDLVGALTFASDEVVEHSTSTGLPDLNSDQATALEETIDETTVNNVRAHNHTLAAIRSISSYLAEGELAGEEPSVEVHVAETESNFRMLDKSVEVEHTQRKSASMDVNVGVDSSVLSSSSIQAAWSTDCTVHDVMDHTFYTLKDDDVCHGKEAFNNSSFCYQVIKDGKMCQPETLQWDGRNPTSQLQSEVLQTNQAGDSHLGASKVMSNTSFENRSPFDEEDGLQNQRGMRKRLQFEAVEHHIVNPGYSCKVDNSVPNKGSLPVAVPRTHGIGLHLNSIGGLIDINTNMQLPQNDTSMQGKDLLSGCNDQEQESRKVSVGEKSLAGLQSPQLPMSSDNFSPHSASENDEEKQQENQATSSSYQSSHLMKPLQAVQLNPIDQYITPCSVKVRPSEDAIKAEINQSSSEKRKRAESDGCKGCNCKRSKCLKLYCDCFAAGVLCSDACACQGCHNKREHQNTVIETRQLIESRNPLAFAPKVVALATDPPKDSERVTPSSARHKRGCNCKKSLCLKRYCECFQAGVGCSIGCRCNGCKNTFGTKNSDEIIRLQAENSKEIYCERVPCGNLEGRELKIISIEHGYSRLTPLTPFFQGNDMAKSQLPAKYYPSPESGASASPSYESPSSPIDSMNSRVLAKETEGTSGLVPYNQELRFRTALQPDPFSPGWDRLTDICNFSPLANHSPLGSSASAASKHREPRTLHAKLSPGRGRLAAGSHVYRSSPITPLPQLGEGKFVLGPCFDSGTHTNHEDDTPEILKDTCSPIVTVKATSPNQKRISPPHKHLNDMRPSSSSPATGRKFILKSVPSFPPLTPYSNNTRRNDT